YSMSLSRSSCGWAPQFAPASLQSYADTRARVASIRRVRCRWCDLADRRCGMAGPAETDEPAVGVVEIVETVEEVHAGIDERRPHPTDENEPRRRQRISGVADREAVERLGCCFGRNRNRELGPADQCGRAAIARDDR